MSADYSKKNKKFSCIAGKQENSSGNSKNVQNIVKNAQKIRKNAQKE